ncbi:MAG: bifunctional phosphopantothenoylcysteine decarboxylase/phosphopantothenate--cysteine ligase CoaBC [Candidatus Thermoplasmatota archaeon]|nr:bifunctional phosphopantothenoylcysteine decarboxylase/phosphopantothenate--cysteine ligase CoaBC [Candidatus Thermoplasmatota archaeon]
MHPSRDIYCSKSEKLRDKKIVVGVTGSIAAVETIKLIRELIRHGADVFPVMTENAQKIIHPASLFFASGKKTITEITGDVEHVSLCGDVEDKADLLLIAPCTANTISKIANGIDDTTVTTFATTAIGSELPVVIVPAMHSSMYNHPIVTENIRKLRKIGVNFIEPRIEEKKAKMPGNEEIVENVIRRIGENDLRNKKILIISGSTSEAIDDVRTITNKSSGKTGIELAKNAFERGANVKLMYGDGTEKTPGYIETEMFTSADELGKKLKKLKYDIILVPAAISDYTVKKYNGKIPSGQKTLNLKLKPTSKIIKIIRKNFKGFLVGFKLESHISREKLLEKAYKYLKENNLDLIVANDIKNVKPDKNEVIIVDRKKNIIMIKDRKEKIAEKIFDLIAREMK